MRLKDDRYSFESWTERFSVVLLALSGATNLALDIAIAVLTGKYFRDLAPWSFYLAISLGTFWFITNVYLILGILKLIGLVEEHRMGIKIYPSSVHLPLGKEGLGLTLGSAAITGAVLYIASCVHNELERGLSSYGPLEQFNIFFPISMAVQAIAIASFLKQADTFSISYRKIKEMVRLSGPNGTESDVRQDSLMETLKSVQKGLEYERLRADCHELQLNSLLAGSSSLPLFPQASKPPRSNPILSPSWQQMQQWGWNPYEGSQSRQGSVFTEPIRAEKSRSLPPEKSGSGPLRQQKSADSSHGAKSLKERAQRLEDLTESESGTRAIRNESGDTVINMPSSRLDSVASPIGSAQVKLPEKDSF